MPSWPKGGDAVFARIYGAATLGLNGHVIAVETDISNGLPSFDLVGLASTSVKEAKERVRAAVKNSGYEFPMRRLTVNLAPADLKKDTSGLDLSLARFPKRPAKNASSWGNWPWMGASGR